MTHARIYWRGNGTSFEVQRRTAVSGQWQKLATVPKTGRNIVSYLDRGLSAFTSYEYRVYADNAAGRSPESTVTWVNPSQSRSSSVLANLTFDSSPQSTWTTVFGSPTVVSSFEGMSGALAFAVGSTYDQINITPAKGYAAYQIDFDVVVRGFSGSSSSFGLILDTLAPVSEFELTPLGSTFTMGQLDGGGGVIGFYNDRQIYHVSLFVDLLAAQWAGSLDGVASFREAFHGASIQGLRFTLSPWGKDRTNFPDTGAAIDNFRITGMDSPSDGALLPDIYPIPYVAPTPEPTATPVPTATPDPTPTPTATPIVAFIPPKIQNATQTRITSKQWSARFVVLPTSVPVRLTASAAGHVRVIVRGTNPFRVTVSKMKRSRVSVRLVATNTQGKSYRLLVVRSGPVNP